MQTTVERCLETGVVTVRFEGELDRTTAPEVRTALGKAAAECPTAVLVDLSALERVEPASFSVFATATFKAESDWGVPLLLYAARPDVRKDLATYRSFVALYDDRALALAAMRAYVPRWICEHLAPVPGSAAAARGVVGDACLMWGLPRLRDRARLIVSELASNAILHAATDFSVTAVCTGRYLRIAVQDRSSQMPLRMPKPAVDHPQPGWGLRVVEASSTHWGALPLTSGKIVWALLTTGR
ncbi:ATP-binding protein [Actinoplanes ianthinogenes]|uniref:ATP-binding protein n=1 Tax=Actinoplanes ianthinogenes TaxID=122358 RepID=A0ABN6C4C6_9ACTN|nr:STAS domain-containing protein [Actinoplanes ianthinogenes]BCJ39411.1 ATP-binding protein [Actinoplanes ianthinogenes]GGR36307.1 ATP-binding protein [Actinoplanes ianthinogenes]